MWDAISSVLTNQNSWAVLSFVFLVIVIVLSCIRDGLISINTGSVFVGKGTTERHIIRQQVEWAKLHILGVENKLPHPKNYDQWHSRYILECIYDEVIDWITFNHLTDSPTYIEIKQDRVISLVNSLTMMEDFKTQEFQEWMKKETETIIRKLLQIREVYNKREMRSV